MPKSRFKFLLGKLFGYTEFNIITLQSHLENQEFGYKYLNLLGINWV